MPNFKKDRSKFRMSGFKAHSKSSHMYKGGKWSAFAKDDKYVKNNPDAKSPEDAGKVENPKKTYSKKSRKIDTTPRPDNTPQTDFGDDGKESGKPDYLTQEQYDRIRKRMKDKEWRNREKGNVPSSTTSYNPVTGDPMVDPSTGKSR